ncbi:hypothetical protein [Microcoleus sp. herbarium12]|uniref:hypothetical protein n=1 Tax=Microcoleus sp. herbarium12 TaxID=3055437 RepID=UPI002FD05CB1
MLSRLVPPQSKGLEASRSKFKGWLFAGDLSGVTLSTVFHEVKGLAVGYWQWAVGCQKLDCACLGCKLSTVNK